MMGQEMKHQCPDCLEVGGKYFCDMNCGPAVDPKTGVEIKKAAVLRDMASITSAINLAVEVHGSQVDKGGDPYIWHPLRVGFSLLPDVDACILGILHDVCEDGTLSTVTAVEQVLAGNRRLIDALATLTRGNEPYEQYIQNCARSPLATHVKLADLRDNLNTLRLEKAGHRCGAEKMFALRNRYQASLTVLER
jgi:(p)ppGpp synthase/HD superfamily hydrolase